MDPWQMPMLPWVSAGSDPRIHTCIVMLHLLKIFDVPRFNCVFSVDKFASGIATLISFTSMILSPKEDFCVLVPKQCYDYNIFVFLVYIATMLEMHQG